MKLKYFNSLSILIILSLSFSAIAQETDICAGKKKIIYDDSNIQSKIDGLYKDPELVQNNIYYFCFERINTLISGSGAAYFTKKDDKDVYLTGLTIKANSSLSNTTPLLTITNNMGGTVYVKNINLSSVLSGLSLTGSGKIVVENSVIVGSSASTGTCLSINSPDATITGTDISNCATGIKIGAQGVNITGIPRVVNGVTAGIYAKCSSAVGTKGIDILADGAVIKAMDISGCGDGIRIGASNTLLGASDAANYDTNKNIIHNNNIGINVTAGRYNRFGFNSIYTNGFGANIGTNNGISILSGANESLARPRIVSENENWLMCKADSNGKIVGAEIKFQVQEAGEIQIYKTDVERRYKQGIDLATVCHVEADGICKISDTSFLSNFSSSCGLENYYLTALLTDADGNSTMYLAEPFEFYRQGIVASPTIDTPIDIPGVSDTGGESDISEGNSGEVAQNTQGDNQTAPSDGSGEYSAYNAIDAQAGVAASSRCGMIPNPLTRTGTLEFIFILLSVNLTVFGRLHLLKNRRPK